MNVANAIKIIPAWILLGLILLVGCSRLPNFSKPRVEATDAFRSSKVISYRDLTVGDFHAKVLPEDLRSNQQDLNAHTSIAIRTLSGAKYVFSLQGDDSSQLWCGNAEKLAFEAVMLTEKSWWSSTLAKDKEVYVLQHEQIHFAMMEVAARQLTRRVTKERAQFVNCAANIEDVKDKMSAIVDRYIAELENETLRRHEEFDEATSRLYAPKVQQKWFDRVMRELLELSEWKNIN